jgi:hypothetical protein
MKYWIIFYLIQKTKKKKTKDLVFDVREKMIKEIELLSYMEKLNNVDENNGE